MADNDVARPIGDRYTALLWTILLLKQDGFLLANLYQSVFLSSSVIFCPPSFSIKAIISFIVGFVLAILCTSLYAIRHT